MGFEKMNSCDLCKKVIPQGFKPNQHLLLEDEFRLVARWDVCQECYDRNYAKLEKRDISYLFKKERVGEQK
jgi:hypothetical protein